MTFRVPLRPLVLSVMLGSALVGLAWTSPTAGPVRIDAQDPPAREGRENKEGGDDLEDVMHGMDKAFEGVIAAIEKKDAPAALALMTKMQQACISAKTLTPPKIRTVEEKDKAAFVAGYRKQMMQLLKGTADLEIALVDADMDAAKKAADAIDAIKKSGHDAYKKMPRKKKE